LKNFRVHADVVYDLSERGVTIITGESGRGKTTLFEAVEWCLYGGRKPNIGHMASVARKSSVQITRGVLHRIYRSRCPGHLEVNVCEGGKTLRMEEAQAKLNEVFGAREVFGACCYIQQKGMSAFLSLCPGDRRKILENVFFDARVSEMVQSVYGKSGQEALSVRGERSSLERDTQREQARADELVASLDEDGHAHDVASPSSDGVTDGRDMLQKLRTCEAATASIERELECASHWHSSSQKLAAVSKAIEAIGREGDTIALNSASDHRRGIMKGRMDVLEKNTISLEHKLEHLQRSARPPGRAAGLSAAALIGAKRAALLRHNTLAKETRLLGVLFSRHGLSADLDEVEQIGRARETVEARRSAERCAAEIEGRLSVRARAFVGDGAAVGLVKFAERCLVLRELCTMRLRCPQCDAGLVYDRASRAISVAKSAVVDGAKTPAAVVEWKDIEQDAVVLAEFGGEMSRHADAASSSEDALQATRLLRVLADLELVRRELGHQRSGADRRFSVEELEHETARRKCADRSSEYKTALCKNRREGERLFVLMASAERTMLLHREKGYLDYFASGVRHPDEVALAREQNGRDKEHLDEVVRRFAASSKIMATRVELASRRHNAGKSRTLCAELVSRETALMQVRDAVKMATEQLIGDKLDAINSRMAKMLEALFCGDSELVPRCRLVSNRPKKSKSKRTAPKKGAVLAQQLASDTKWEISLVSEHAGFSASGSSFFSGGEYDRVSLALALAIAETTGARFVMLDETLGSVGEDTANRVIGVLERWSTRCGGAPVYLIAHQLDGNGCSTLAV